jgi:hypothetical protein
LPASRCKRRTEGCRPPDNRWLLQIFRNRGIFRPGFGEGRLDGPFDFGRGLLLGRFLPELGRRLFHGDSAPSTVVVGAVAVGRFDRQAEPAFYRDRDVLIDRA